MTWYLLAALVLPPLIIYIYMHTGQPHRPRFTGNGDIYGPLPNAAGSAIEGIKPDYVDSVRSQYNRI